MSNLNYGDNFPANIHTIKINIQTNVPGLKPFDFQPNMLSINDNGNIITNNLLGSSDILFTDEIEFPQNIIKNMSYAEKFRFFQKPLDFKRILSNQTKKMQTLKDEKIKIEELRKKNIDMSYNNTELLSLIKQQQIRRSLIGENNVNILLETYFPTTFPSKNNILLSSTNFKPTNTVSNFISDNYSYIKVNGKIYTILKIVLLNDIVNHPILKNIIKYIVKYNKWLNEKAKPKIKKEFEKELYKLLAKLKKINLTETTNDIISFLTKNQKQTEKAEININNFKDLLQKYPINLIGKYDINDNVFLDNLEYDINKYGKMYDTLYKKINYNRIFPFEFLEKIKKLTEQLTKISKQFDEAFILQKTNIFLNKISLDKPNDNTIIETDKDEDDDDKTDKKQDYFLIRKKIDSQFKEYNVYEKALVQYLHPEKMNNLFLYEKIKEQFSNLAVITPFFMNIKNGNMNQINTADLSIGLTKTISVNNSEDISLDNENHFFNIYLHMDFIEGEINRQNQSSIECYFKGEVLGESFLNLTNKYYKSNIVEDNYLPFISIDHRRTKTLKNKNNQNKTKKQKI